MRQSLRVPPSWPTLQRHFEKRRSSVAPSRPDQRMLLRFCSDHQEEVSLLDLGHSNLLLPLWLGRGASPGTYSNHQCLKSLPCFGNHERTLHVFFFPTRRHEMTETPTETPGCQRTGYGHESGSKTWAWEAIITLFSITAWGHIIQLGQDLWCDSLGTKPLFNKKRQSRTEQVSQPSKWLVTLVTGRRRRCQKHQTNPPILTTNIHGEELKLSGRSCKKHLGHVSHVILFWPIPGSHPALLEQNHQRSCQEVKAFCWDSEKSQQLGGKPGVSSKRKWLR